MELLSKDVSEISPWKYRPLTLIYQNAAFGPEILAYRLNQVIPGLLHPDQYGFVPGESFRYAYCRLYIIVVNSHRFSMPALDPRILQKLLTTCINLPFLPH